MSQERTEPYFLEFDEAEQLFLKFFVENSTHTLTIRGQQEALSDLLTAHREIDRLNAVNADLTAKVQERDTENERLRAEVQSSADDLRELMEVAYRDCPYEAQKIADRLVAALKGEE